MKKGNKAGTSDYGPQQLTPFAWVLIVLVALSALLVPVLLSLDTSIVARYSLTKYHVGQLCDEDVYAPATFEFVDEAKTKEALENAQKAILPTFSYSLNQTLKATSRMETFENYWATGTTSEASQRIELWLSDEGIVDARQIVARFASLSAEDRKNLLVAARETMQNLLSHGVCDDEDLDEIRQEGYQSFVIQDLPGASQKRTLATIDYMASIRNLEKNLTDWLETYTFSISGYHIVLLEDTLQLFMLPNIYYDRNTTTLERQKAKDSTAPIYITINKGDKILEKDKVITESQIDLLEKVASHRGTYTILEIIGMAVYVVLVTSSGIMVFLMFIPHAPRRYQYLNFALVALLISQVGSYFIFRYTKQLPFDLSGAQLPYLFPPIFIALITGKKRYGVGVAFLCAAYPLLLPDSTIMTFFTYMTNCLICVFFFQHTDRKVENIYHWMYACIACIFVQVSLSLVQRSATLENVIPVIAALMANITITDLLVSLLVSICESVFNLPTESRLNELAYHRSPLLEKLQVQAIGTYNHSENVAKLAYETASAIGANALLARVGGLYHDIGKMDYPEYFVENQGEGNKQNALKPSLSVAIIKSHVKIGVDKGRQGGLPLEVIDIISEHHGNDVIAFFYHKAQTQAKEANNGGNLVSETDYRYDAPLPDSREAALVMICDSVEAASHTIKQPNVSQLSKLCHNIIMQKIEHGQLKMSHLSMNDLELIKTTLVKNLVGMNHHRIEYPKEKQAASYPEPKPVVEEPAESTSEDGDND